MLSKAIIPRAFLNYLDQSLNVLLEHREIPDRQGFIYRKHEHEGKCREPRFFLSARGMCVLFGIGGRMRHGVLKRT